MTTHTEHDLDLTTVAPAETTGTVRPRLMPSVVWAVVVFLGVLAAGGVFVATRTSAWSAQATAMVIPDPKLGASAAAAYYESLGSGQVLATVAEIVRLQRLQNGAADDLSLTPSQRDDVTVSVELVADTTIIQITAVAPTEDTATGLANGVLAEASSYAGLPDPYVLSPLADAAGTAEQSDAPRLAYAGVVVLVALVAALATQQAVYQLGVALGNRRGRTEPTVHPEARVPTPRSASRDLDMSS